MQGSQRRRKCWWNYQPDPLCSLGPDPKSRPTVYVHASGCLCLQPQQQTGTLEQNPLHSLTKWESSLSFLESHCCKAWSFHPVNLCPSQFTVECEWQRQETQTVTVPVPHILSFGVFSAHVCTLTLSFVHHWQLRSPCPPLHAGQTQERLRRLGHL